MMKIPKLLKKFSFDVWVSMLFFCLGIVTRIPFLEKIQSHWDGPQYSIAVVRYSFIQETPAPPGYPFYIGMGKFFYLFVHDPHAAMLMVSVLGSGIGAAVLFLFTKKIYGKVAGVFCATIFLTGSTFYFFGITTYAYGLLPIFILLIAYYSYLSYIKKQSHGVLFGLVSGLLFGIRPQEMLFMGPLALLGFLFLRNKDKVYATIVFISITLCWFIPVSNAVGGVNVFFEKSSEFSKTAIPSFSFLRALSSYEVILKGFLLSFGLSVLFLLYYPYWFFALKKKKKIPFKQVFFFVIWIVPGFFFNLFMRSDHAGYQMSYLTAFLLLIGIAFSKSMPQSKKYIVLVGAIVAVSNLFVFFYDRDPYYTKPYRPTSFHYMDIRKNDVKVGGKISYIKKNYSFKDTLIITTPVLFRPYMYYLKEYKLIDLSMLIDKYTLRRDAYKWNMNQYDDISLSIQVPKNIKNVVFTDDTASVWIKEYPHKTISLPGNSFLTHISVRPSTVILYDYQSIKIVPQK